jgi:N-acetylmuramoyl-L-alanine amidase
MVAMSAPRILTAADLRLQFRDVFGPLGPAASVTGHFSGGPRAGDWRQAMDVARRLHVEHLDHGWGGCGYHYLLADDGSLLCLRPAALQGAHVGGHNGGNVGILCAGTTGHRPTRAQRETYAWLLGAAHTAELPALHRTTGDLRRAGLHVHHGWHGHSTNPCAGWFEDMFLAGTCQPGAGGGVDPGAARRVTSAGYPPSTEFQGIVADGRHVSVLEAHRAAAARDRDARAGVERDDPIRDRGRRFSVALDPTV